MAPNPIVLMKTPSLLIINAAMDITPMMGHALLSKWNAKKDSIIGGGLPAALMVATILLRHIDVQKHALAISF